MLHPFLCQAVLVLSVFTVFSSALPPNLNLNLLANFGTPATNDTSEQDLTNPILSYSADCSSLYGRNLNGASCSNALAKISEVTAPETFGQRGTGDWDVVLPRRYLSGTLW